MFAGIVKGRGRITALDAIGGDVRLAVDLGGVDLGEPATGASIAINGVCLTALEPVRGSFLADVSRETLAVTTLGAAAVGDPVNLETSLRLGDPVDGHLVYGHVDAVGSIRSLDAEARSWRIGVAMPEALARYVATKGSVAVDGVSLTVNAVDAVGFEVNVIPHTWETTIIQGYRVGTTVNIEVDMMARYAERLRQYGFSGDE